MYNCCGKAFNMMYFTQLYNPSKHMFNVWRLKVTDFVKKFGSKK